MNTATAAPVVTRHSETVTVGHPYYVTVRDYPTVTVATEDASYYGIILSDGRFAELCGKCGSGSRPGAIEHFGHVLAGVCFACDGTGRDKARDEADVVRLVRRRSASARRARAAAEAAAEAAAKAAEEARKEEEAARAAARAAADASRYLGEVGEKVTATGTVRAAKVVSGYAYGSSQIFLIITGEDFTLKAYTSAQWAYEVSRGDVVTVAATVKRHETGRDSEKVTLVSRVKRAS